MMNRRTNFRSDLEWAKEGLPLGTASPEAAKMFDASLTQLALWSDDPALGGFGVTLQKMVEADPHFVIGRAFKANMDLMGGRSPRISEQLNNEVQELRKMVKTRKDLDDRQRLHAEAAIKWSEADPRGANALYEEILIRWPTDFLALRLAHIGHVLSGEKRELRDSIARVYPLWAESNLPLKECVHGMFAFGLEENNMYQLAEKEAKRGLELNPFDGWAAHALAHVLEMQGRYQEGAEFLRKNESNWKVANHISVHNAWHQALFNIELCDYESSLEVFDQYMEPIARSSGTIQGIIDTSAFLHRLGIAFPTLDLDERWKRIMPYTKPHLKNHMMAFYDAHCMLACLGSKDSDAVNEMRNSFKSIKDSTFCGHLVDPIFDSFAAYYEGRYEEVVEKLAPIRYETLRIGGSEAQRDLFDQTLIVSAIKSEKESHRYLAKRLLDERKILKPNSRAVHRRASLSN